MRLILFLALAIIMISCAPNVRVKMFQKQDFFNDISLEKVVLASLNDSLPGDVQPLGTIKIGGSKVFSNFDYQTAVDAAKFAAARNGANAIRVVKLRNKSTSGNRYRFNAELYYFSENQMDSLVNQQSSNFSCPKDSSRLIVYRTYDYQGSGMKFNLHLDEEKIGQMKPNAILSKNLFIVGGAPTLWARTETKDELKLNLDRGNVQFVKATVDLGFFVGRPKLKIVSQEHANIEIAWIESKKR